MIIEKENYDLVIGNDHSSEYKTVRYVFDGWHDIKKQKKFHGCVEYLSHEIYAERVPPVSKISRSILNIICWDDILRFRDLLKLKEKLRESDRKNKKNIVAPAIGTIIDITYRQDFATVEEVEDYIKNCGVSIHRADPFVKPQKTLWQVIKERIREKKK